MGAQKTVGIAAAIALLLTIDPVVAATPKAKTPPKETQPVAAVPVPRPRPTPPAIARSAPAQAPSTRAALRIDDEVLDSVERLSLLPPGAVVKPAAPVDEEPVAAAVAAINPIKAAVAAPAVAAIKAPPRPAAAPPGEAAPPPASLMGGPLRPLTAEQRALALRALALIEGGQADKGGALADQLRGQTALVSYLDYERLRRSGSGASFGEITEFVRTHRDWPRQEMLQRRAEEAITGSEPADRLMAWFAENPPVTGIGMVRYGELLAARGGDAQPWLRRAWIEGTFSPQEEAAFLGRNGSHLAAIDHYRRADRLLWESNVAADAVRRLLPMLDDGHRALVEARLAFRLGTKNPEGLVARVPQKLVGDPGLAYERIRARERQGRDDDSDIALSGPPADPAQGDKFWALRQAQARKALADGRVAAAYRYAANHGALSGGSLAEAEFLAGWIALRLNENPRQAIQHFEKLNAAVKFPISKARAAYWLGRSHEAGRDPAVARRWYLEAAEHPTTFYGQLALGKLGQRNSLDLPAAPKSSPAERERFNRRELVAVVRQLDELGQADRLRPFLLRLQETSATLGERALTAQLAREIGRVDLALAVAKRAHQGGHLVTDAYFPIIDVLSKGDFGLDPAVVMAVARQESEFNAGAVSPAGALGLMQLMPATAKEVSRKLNLSYAADKLTNDPRFNATLGSSYMAGLIENWSGNLALAAAAYNAGEGRVRKWIKDWGDPRTGEIDPVDWIEMIPFSETRNYVQRVVEGVQVYRQLTRGSVPMTLDADIRGRGTGRRAEATAE